MSYEVIKRMIILNWPLFARGALMTIWISIIGTVIGFIIGLLAGLVRTIPQPEKKLSRVILKLSNILLEMDHSILNLL